MEAILAVKGDGFVMTLSDTNAARGITVLKKGLDRSRALTSHTLLVYSGEASDTTNFAEYIQKNAKLQHIINEFELTPLACATFIRNTLAQSLRSRGGPYDVSSLVAGYDVKTGKPQLYWLDYLAAMNEVEYGGHGYAAFLCVSILDRFHRPGMTVAEVEELLRLCVKELEHRFVINLPEWKIKIVDANGIRDHQMQF
ncbi:N-terminal nucleophile aminohydrolase [Ramicandelaber brevisporus]|nr:N-terminal nucleophile aminohydrolase [Ramicandelaber brevisporus]